VRLNRDTRFLEKPGVWVYLHKGKRILIYLVLALGGQLGVEQFMDMDDNIGAIKEIFVWLACPKAQQIIKNKVFLFRDWIKVEKV